MSKQKFTAEKKIEIIEAFKSGEDAHQVETFWGMFDKLAFPYLFERVQNRISLVHDSLNTYLRYTLISYPIRYEVVKDTVQKSLKAYEVEYMDRLL